MSNDFIQNAVNNLYRDNEIAALNAENARLKAEVERLTLLQSETLAERNKAEAQVERLTKAGDVMATMLQFDEVSKAWNAAKGVQS